MVLNSGFQSVTLCQSWFAQGDLSRQFMQYSTLTRNDAEKNFPVLCWAMYLPKHLYLRFFPASIE